MKRCPQCRRDYIDDTLRYCLDDGTQLLDGPASDGSPFSEQPTRTNLTEAGNGPRTEILDPDRIVRPSGSEAETVPARPNLTIVVGVTALLLAAILVGGAWVQNRSNVSWATAQVPRVGELARSGKRFEAYDLALELQKYLPGDTQLTTLMPSIADRLTVTTEPAGASVYLKRYQPDENGRFPDRQLVGTTPIAGLQIPRGPQMLYIEKEGYAALQKSILGSVATVGIDISISSPPIEIAQTLPESGSVPDKMAFVPGGEYRLASSTRPTDDKALLDDFFIDKYEVSNRDYKEFIVAGGYLKREYWKVPAVKDGRTLSWDEEMALFHDRTSLPGPREWTNQNYPTEKADHPVTGITWYEAAAYAEFRGKKLPTVFQWEKASRDGKVSLVSSYMPWGMFLPGDSLKYRANFDSEGTLPVDSGEFGVSPFGAFNMAGNVSEWTLNEGSDGFFATGGGWGEPPYTYSYFGVYPALFQSNKRGFRCVKLAAPERAAGDQGASRIDREQAVPDYPRTTEAQFRDISRVYAYDKRPLNAEIVEVNETTDWRREKITFDGANGERAIAYLYLPHNAPRPLQVIQLIPGSNVENGIDPVPNVAEAWLAPTIKSGRAVLAVVVKGNVERLWPPDFVKPKYESVEWVDLLVNRYTDHRRGLDYLETRDDIDRDRIAFFGGSAGASSGLILAAIEDRYRSVFLASAGLPSFFTTNQPAANPINFAPHIRAPKFILNGRYDEAFPLKTSVEPMMKLFTEPKQLELFDGPHTPPMEVLVPAVNNFLDKTLGPVGRK